MELKPIRFIAEPIEAHFREAPLLEKVPGCPQAFSWREQLFTIEEMLSEWHDYRRRGRMARNMKPEHAAVAAGRGSWGVGLDYYRVRTAGGRIFDIYFDRAPKSVDSRKGSWYIEKELGEVE